MKQKEEGFVPVQYKILKLSSKLITSAQKKYVKKDGSSGITVGVNHPQAQCLC